MNNAILNPQEVVGDYKFDSQVYMTRGFIAEFGNAAMHIVMTTMQLIHKRRDEVGADYLQTATYDGIRYWIIDDVDHITFLLPSEY